MIARCTGLALAGLLVLGSAEAFAQTPPPAGIEASPAGRVITRKTLTACKQQAKDLKLSYLKRRKFLRDCVAGKTP